MLNRWGNSRNFAEDFGSQKKYKELRVLLIIMQNSNNDFSYDASIPRTVLRNVSEDVKSSLLMRGFP